MRRFVVALALWMMALMGLVLVTGVVTLLGESRGISGFRAVPLFLVNAFEALGVMLPFAALGGACAAQRRASEAPKRLPAVTAVLVSALAVGGVATLLVAFVAPALRRSVIASAYRAEGAPSFDPRGMSLPELLRDHALRKRSAAATVATAGERVAVAKLGSELYRRTNVGMLGFVLCTVGWFIGWWVAMISRPRPTRLIELGAVLFFVVVAFVSDYIARGLPPTWANLVALMVPGTALGVLAFCSWAVTASRHFELAN